MNEPFSLFHLLRVDEMRFFEVNGGRVARDGAFWHVDSELFHAVDVHDHAIAEINAEAISRKMGERRRDRGGQAVVAGGHGGWEVGETIARSAFPGRTVEADLVPLVEVFVGVAPLCGRQHRPRI